MKAATNIVVDEKKPRKSIRIIYINIIKNVVIGYLKFKNFFPGSL